MKMQAVFDRIYERNSWNSAESRSGPGSSLSQTRLLIERLPALLRATGARSLLDIPCGDFHWMRHVALFGIDYLGADVVQRIVASNRSRYGAPGIRFGLLDVTRDPLPRSDVVLCRDCLVHFTFDEAIQALKNIAASGSTYLLATTFTDRAENRDCRTGEWRVLNLERAPFDLPPPLQLLNEGCTEGGGAFKDKSLGLWRLSDIGPILANRTMATRPTAGASGPRVRKR